MACPMVLQAVVGDLQLLPSLPLTPLTYHVVLAKAGGARAENSAKSSKVLIVSWCFMVFLLLSRSNRRVRVLSPTVLTSRLIALLFIRSHVAALLIRYILRVGTRITRPPLIGRQQVA